MTLHAFLRTYAAAMIGIGVFLTVFHGVYMKRKTVGPGIETPEKRIAWYVAIGIGAGFFGGGVLFSIYGP